MTRSKLVALVYRIVICEKRNKALSELALRFKKSGIIDFIKNLLFSH